MFPISVKRLLLLAFAAGPLAAQPAPIPDTAAGRQFAHWLEVFNRGQRDEIQKYLKENDPQTDIDGQMAFRHMTGGFDFQKIEESNPEKATGIVKERASGSLARFVIEVDPKPPHMIKQFGLRLIPPESGAAARLSQKDAIAALEAELRKQTADDRFAGAVMVAKGHQLYFRPHTAPPTANTSCPTGWTRAFASAS